MRRLLVAVLLSTPLLAQSPEEWDLERRLAERFDDARNAERIAAAKAKSSDLSGAPTETPGSRHYLIVGWRNPELFLPHELFDALVGADQSGRDSYGAKLGDFGWEAASFWTTLDQLSAGYLALRYKQRTASGAAAACRARFDALERARESFGKKKFDAFLYSAIPPGMVSTTSTPEPDPAASLRRAALGCPTDPNYRHPWEWTIEQRLAARNVAADRKRRVDQLLATPAARAKSPRPYDHLQGSIRPELLLPTEIVDVLIDVLASDDERAAQARADAVEGAADVDLPPEFFPAFEKAFAGAIATYRELARMARKYPPGQVVSGQVASRLTGLQQDACRGRWKGIQTLRATYGKAFDRFLYEVVALKVRKTYLVPISADALRDQARGCP